MAATRRNVRPSPAPAATDGVAVFVAGTVAWALAFFVLLGLRSTLDAHGAAWWIWVPVAGFCIGLIGVALTLRHRARTGP